MRASQFTAGIFAGALALLSVMSTAEKPFDAKGESEGTTAPPATTLAETKAAPQTTAPTQPPTAEHYVGEFYPVRQYTYNPAASKVVPSAFTVEWEYVCMPIRDKDDPNYEPKYGYVLENVRNGSDSYNSPLQVKYIRKYNYSETFDLRDFDPNKEPELYSWSNYSGNQQALIKSVNQAIKDDYARKSAAYKYWKAITSPTEAPTDKYPDTPSAYTVTWNGIRIPNTDKNDPHYNEEYGYVLEEGPGIPDPYNKDRRLFTWQVQYITVNNYTETFDFRYFDPDVKPILYDVSNLLKQANPARWALNTSINEAVLSDHERKVTAFKRWRNEVEYGIYTPTAAPTYDPTEPTTRYIPTTQPYTTAPTYPPTTVPRLATDPTQPTTRTISDLSRGDINHDGYINAKDASILLRYAAAYGTGQNPKLDDFLD